MIQIWGSISKELRSTYTQVFNQFNQYTKIIYEVIYIKKINQT